MKKQDRCAAPAEADASSDAAETPAAEETDSSKIRAALGLRGSTVGALAVIGIVVGFTAGAVSNIEEVPAAPLQAVALGGQPAVALTAPEPAGSTQEVSSNVALPVTWD